LRFSISGGKIKKFCLAAGDIQGIGRRAEREREKDRGRGKKKRNQMMPKVCSSSILAKTVQE
jgi:hypothetical protein